MIAQGREIKPLEPIIDVMLGKPFKAHARGPDAYYCLGLVLDVIHRATGIWIPDPFDGKTVTEGDMAALYGHFVEVPELVDVRPLDVLYSRREGNAHLAIVENCRWVASVREWEGVVRDPLREELRLAERAHRLKELA